MEEPPAIRRPSVEAKVHQCSECQYSSTSPVRLMNHVKKKHPEMAASSPDDIRTPRMSPMSTSSIYSTPEVAPPRQKIPRSPPKPPAQNEEPRPGPSKATVISPQRKESKPHKCRTCTFSADTEDQLLAHQRHFLHIDEDEGSTTDDNASLPGDPSKKQKVFIVRLIVSILFTHQF